MDITTVIAVSVTAVGSLLTAVVTRWQVQKWEQRNAETRGSVEGSKAAFAAWEKLFEMSARERKEMKAEIDELRIENRKCAEQYLASLQAEVIRTAKIAELELQIVRLSSSRT